MISLYNNFRIAWNQVEFLVSFLERQSTFRVRETVLRCLHSLFRNNPSLKLYSKFEAPDEQSMELSPSEYEAWKGDWTDDEMLELNKLFSDSEILNCIV